MIRAGALIPDRGCQRTRRYIEGGGDRGSPKVPSFGTWLILEP